MKDAYLHSVEKAVNTYQQNKTLFYTHFDPSSMLEEDEHGKESLIKMPIDLSERVTHLKEELSVSNKRLAFLCAVKMGLKLHKSEN